MDNLALIIKINKRIYKKTGTSKIVFVCLKLNDFIWRAACYLTLCFPLNWALTALKRFRVTTRWLQSYPVYLQLNKSRHTPSSTLSRPHYYQNPGGTGLHRRKDPAVCVLIYAWCTANEVYFILIYYLKHFSLQLHYTYYLCVSIIIWDKKIMYKYKLLHKWMNSKYCVLYY